MDDGVRREVVVKPGVDMIVRGREGEGAHRWMMVRAAKWPARTHSSRGFFWTNWARKPPTNASPAGYEGRRVRVTVSDRKIGVGIGLGWDIG